jgi:hypothetical protein
MGPYKSLSHFYLGESRRLASQERDFGLLWRDGVGGALHRAAWICDTGELYTVRLGPAEDGGGEVELLGVAATLEEIERALKGWHDACMRPDSLLWLHDRAATLAQSPGPLPRPDAPKSAANAKLAALLSALIVGISPAAATAQGGGGRGAYERQSPTPNRGSHSAQRIARHGRAAQP